EDAGLPARGPAVAVQAEQLVEQRLDVVRRRGLEAQRRKPLGAAAVVERTLRESGAPGRQVHPSRGKRQHGTRLLRLVALGPARRSAAPGLNWCRSSTSQRAAAAPRWARTAAAAGSANSGSTSMSRWSVTPVPRTSTGRTDASHSAMVTLSMKRGAMPTRRPP